MVTSGIGQVAICQINETGRSTVSYSIERLLLEEKRNPYHTVLACGVLGAQARMEWMVEKAVELGLAELWFFTTSRTGKKRMKADRLNKVAIAAIKQSRKSFLPQIKEVSLEQILPHKAEQKLVAACDGVDHQHLGHYPAIKNTLMVIGPEGDFTKEEMDAFSSNGFSFCSLGKERLRSETAAVYSLISLNQKTLLNE